MPTEYKAEHHFSRRYAERWPEVRAVLAEVEAGMEEHFDFKPSTRVNLLQKDRSVEGPLDEAATGVDPDAPLRVLHATFVVPDGYPEAKVHMWGSGRAWLEVSAPKRADAEGLARVLGERIDRYVAKRDASRRRRVRRVALAVAGSAPAAAILWAVLSWLLGYKPRWKLLPLLLLLPRCGFASPRERELTGNAEPGNRGNKPRDGSGRDNRRRGGGPGFTATAPGGVDVEAPRRGRPATGGPGRR